MNKKQITQDKITEIIGRPQNWSYVLSIRLLILWGYRWDGVTWMQSEVNGGKYGICLYCYNRPGEVHSVELHYHNTGLWICLECDKRLQSS